jgi:hypothetical protein
MIEIERVHVRNTDRGTVGWVDRDFFENEAFNTALVEVEHDAKPYVPELYKPRDAETYLREKASNSKTEEAEAEVDTNTKDAD